MPRLNMAFEPPFQRANVVSALTPMVGVSLPAEATVKLGIRSRDDNLDAVIDPNEDLCAGVEIDGFADLAELSTFLNALPTAVNDRLTDLRYFPKG